MSFRLGTGRCAAYTASGASGAMQQCGADPTHAGVVLVESRHPVELWLAFTCGRHADQLTGSRPLLARDRAEMQRWQAEETKALAGKPWDRPAPIAVGAQARRRYELAAVRQSG